PHCITDTVAIHCGGSTDNNFVYPILKSALFPENSIYFSGFKRSFDRVNVKMNRITAFTAYDLKLSKYFSYRLRKGCFISHAFDMHKHNARRLPEKMIV